MASIILQGRWRRQPASASVLDDGHWLRPYLRFVFIRGREILRGVGATASGGAKPASYPGRGGGAIQAELLAAASSYYELPHHATYATLAGKATLYWAGTIVTAGTYRHFMGKHTGSGGTNNPFDFRTTSDGGAVAVLRANASGTNVGSFAGTTVIPTARPTSVIFAQDGGDFGQSARIWTDGAMETVASSVSSSGAATDNGAVLRIGQRADGATVAMNGYCALAWGANVLIPDALGRELHDNPWQIFLATPRRLYMPGAAAAGRTTKNTRTWNLGTKVGYSWRTPA